MSRLADKIQERRGIRVRNFKTMAEIRKAVPEIVATYNQTFVENWEYVPVTPKEAEAVADQMLQITRPELVKVIVNREDQIVGFLVAFINVGRALQRCQGTALSVWVVPSVARDETHRVPGREWDGHPGRVSWLGGQHCHVQ